MAEANASSEATFTLGDLSDDETLLGIVFRAAVKRLEELGVEYENPRLKVTLALEVD